MRREEGPERTRHLFWPPRARSPPPAPKSLISRNHTLYFSHTRKRQVFGPAPGNTAYSEWDRHRPTNPYSSSKSGAENICLAYENTYKLPVMIVNVMNAFGERQHPEKFIPKTIRKLLLGEVRGK